MRTYITRSCLSLFAVFSACGIGLCRAQATTCHTYAGKFAGGLCNTQSFVFKRCADPLSLNVDALVKTEADKGATTYTSAKCLADSQALDANILAPGCAAMGGKLDGTAICDKEQYCDHVKQTIRLSNTCSFSGDCPAGLTPTESKPCCESIEKLLKKRCSKQNKAKLADYMKSLDSGGSCSTVQCVGAGVALRATQILTFLVVSVSLFLMASV